MPLDPNIPLAAQGPKLVPHQERVVDAMRMRQAQSQMQTAELGRQKTLRDMADAQRIQDVFARGLTLEEAIPEVMKINPTTGMELGKKLQEQRTAKLNATKTEVEIGKQNIEKALQLVRGVTDEASFAKMLPMIEGASPEIAAALGPVYDKKRHETVTQMGMSAKEAAEHQLTGLKMFTEGKLDVGVGRILSTVNSQEELDGAMRTFATMGVPNTVMDTYGRKYDKDYRKRAADLSMTPEERSQAADRESQRIDREERRKISWAEYNLKVKDAKLKEADVVNLSDEAIKMIATQFAQTATMPALGAGPAALKVRQRIFNEAAVMFPGLQPGLVKAMYDSNKAALGVITKSEATIKAFEGTAKDNLKIMVREAKKLKDLGSPYLNRQWRSFSRGVLGSPDLAAFETARQAAVGEIGKIIQGSTGSAAGLTEGMREEMNHMMDPSFTMDQIYAAANVLLQDVDNRTKHLAKEKTLLLDQLRTAPAQTQVMESPGAQPTPQPVLDALKNARPGQATNYSGKVYRKGADGKITVVPPLR
jgi:hypothetical protein